MYAIGIDPVWYKSENELQFINNLKMKMAVIFGVAHMSLGIFMKAFNAFHFKKPLDFFFEFLPQIILLWVLFGWMNLLIIIKWLTPWYITKDNEPNPPNQNVNRAPGIISVMINMFLGFGETDTEEFESIAGSPDTQKYISIVLLVIALICIPLMLLGKLILILTFSETIGS